MLRRDLCADSPARWREEVPRGAASGVVPGSAGHGLGALRSTARHLPAASCQNPPCSPVGLAHAWNLSQEMSCVGLLCPF